MADVFKGAKVEVYMNVVGEEKQSKETFSDIKENATGTELLDFSDLMAGLCDADHSLSNCVSIVSTSHTR